MPARILHIHKNLNPDWCRRYSISEAERKALQQQYYNHPDWDQKQLQLWFLEAYRQSINQSTLSESLSSQYKHLDSKRLQRDQQGQSKQREAAYPILEQALFEWQQRLQNKKVPITGDMIQETASWFWKMIPALTCNPEPKFNNKWLDGFKKYYRIKKYK